MMQVPEPLKGSIDDLTRLRVPQDRPADQLDRLDRRVGRAKVGLHALLLVDLPDGPHVRGRFALWLAALDQPTAQGSQSHMNQLCPRTGRLFFQTTI